MINSEKFKFFPSKIPGCFLVHTKNFFDKRGTFIKLFNEEAFDAMNMQTRVGESYFTISHAGVFRGLHFQTPPFDHSKLVYCINGSALDIVADIRRGSPTYGQFELFHLPVGATYGVYLAPGLAHGFLALVDQTTMFYQVSSTHSPEHDCGIHWSSFDIRWPIENFIISKRDSGFPKLNEFHSPFNY